MQRMIWWHRCPNLGESYENVGIVGIIITPIMIIRIIIITIIFAIHDNCGTHIIVSAFLEGLHHYFLRLWHTEAPWLHLGEEINTDIKSRNSKKKHQ